MELLLASCSVRKAMICYMTISALTANSYALATIVTDFNMQDWVGHVHDQKDSKNTLLNYLDGIFI